MVKRVKELEQLQNEGRGEELGDGERTAGMRGQRGERQRG